MLDGRRIIDLPLAIIESFSNLLLLKNTQANSETGEYRARRGCVRCLESYQSFVNDAEEYDRSALWNQNKDQFQIPDRSAGKKRQYRTEADALGKEF